MMYTSKQVADGLILFAEQEILPTLQGWKLYAGSAALFILAQRAGTLMSEVIKNTAVIKLGLADENGVIDVNVAADAVRNTIRKYGKITVDIPVLDMEVMLAEKDVNTLVQCIRKAAGEGVSENV